MHGHRLHLLDHSSRQPRTFLHSLLPFCTASLLTIWMMANGQSSTSIFAPLKLYKKIHSPNQSARVRYLIIHYTSINLERSLASFLNPVSKTSAHFLIPAKPQKAWLRKKERALPILTLVPSLERAWHAGRSTWNGQQRLNDNSIGIELENATSSYRAPNKEEYFYYVDFSTYQIEALASLIRKLCALYPQIKPTHILGHSDIAPGRKSDPGPRFPWAELYYSHQIGAWFDADRFAHYLEKFAIQLPPPEQIQRLLQVYGYAIDAPRPYFDVHAERVIKAFQLHFVPYAVSGQVDPETCAALYALVEKYHPEAFASAVSEQRNQLH